MQKTHPAKDPGTSAILGIYIECKARTPKNVNKQRKYEQMCYLTYEKNYFMPHGLIINLTTFCIGKKETRERADLVQVHTVTFKTKILKA